MFLRKYVLFGSYIFFALALVSFFPSEAQAGYLDPGSGSTFVQGIISIFAFFGRIVDKIKQVLGFKKSS